MNEQNNKKDKDIEFHQAFIAILLLPIEILYWFGVAILWMNATMNGVRKNLGHE